MKNRYIQFSYKSEKPKVEEKGISFKKLILLAVALFILYIATKGKIDKDIIIALLGLLK